MFKMNHSVKKYIVSTVFVTSLVFTPVLSGSVLAYGGPDKEAEMSQNNGNNAPVSTEIEEKEAPEVSTAVISMGDRGQDVRNLQAKLQENGYTANPDGIFGNETEEAVRSLQTDQGIAVDGIAGPDTFNALSLNASSSDNVSDDSGNTSSELTIEEAPAQETASNTVESQSDVVSIAQSLVGTPYVFGGTTTEGFDSSGFINYVFKEAGVDLNRTHQAMWDNDGVHVDSPSVGDVVFFEHTYDSPNRVTHSGIYIGNNEMIHAGTGETGVEVESMDWDFWQDSYIGAKSFK